MLKQLENWSGSLLIILAASLWALDGVTRRSLFNLPPITIVFLEHVIGLILISPWAFLAWRREKVSSQVWWVAAAVSLFSSLLGTLWFTTALLKVNFIAFSVVFLLQKLQPIFAASAAAVLLNEKLTRPYLLWAAIAIMAAYFVTFPGGKVNLATGAGTVVAALYAVGAALAWGTGTALSKLMLKEISVTLATGLRFGFTTCMALALLVIMGQSQSLSQVDSSQLGRLVFIAVSTGMVALWIYYRGLQRTPANISTILELVFPALAVVIDTYLYGTWLQPSQYMAAVVLFVAVWQTANTTRNPAVITAI